MRDHQLATSLPAGSRDNVRNALKLCIANTASYSAGTAFRLLLTGSRDVSVGDGGDGGTGGNGGNSNSGNGGDGAEGGVGGDSNAFGFGSEAGSGGDGGKGGSSNLEGTLTGLGWLTLSDTVRHAIVDDGSTTGNEGDGRKDGRSIVGGTYVYMIFTGLDLSDIVRHAVDAKHIVRQSRRHGRHRLLRPYVHWPRLRHCQSRSYLQKCLMAACITGCC